MPTSTSWACGCGTAVAAGPCPACGWSAGVAGQPDRSPRGWLPVVGGIAAVVLLAGGAALFRDTDPGVRFERTGEAITPVTPDHPELDGAVNRALPASLAELLPTGMPGGRWVPVEVAGLSGPLNLDDASSLGGAAGPAAGAERARLESAGFVRAQGRTFAWGETVQGVVIYELASAAHAEGYLDEQAAIVRQDPAAAPVDAPFVEGEVAWTYSVGDGRGMDVVFRIDQLIVREFLAVPVGFVLPTELDTLHHSVRERIP